MEELILRNNKWVMGILEIRGNFIKYGPVMWEDVATDAWKCSCQLEDVIRKLKKLYVCSYLPKLTVERRDASNDYKFYLPGVFIETEDCSYQKEIIGEFGQSATSIGETIRACFRNLQAAHIGIRVSSTLFKWSVEYDNFSFLRYASCPT